MTEDAPARRAANRRGVRALPRADLVAPAGSVELALQGLVPLDLLRSQVAALSAVHVTMTIMTTSCAGVTTCPTAAASS